MQFYWNLYNRIEFQSKRHIKNVHVVHTIPRIHVSWRCVAFTHWYWHVANATANALSFVLSVHVFVAFASWKSNEIILNFHYGTILLLHDSFVVVVQRDFIELYRNYVKSIFFLLSVMQIYVRIEFLLCGK